MNFNFIGDKLIIIPAIALKVSLVLELMEKSNGDIVAEVEYNNLLLVFTPKPYWKMLD